MPSGATNKFIFTSFCELQKESIKDTAVTINHKRLRVGTPAEHSDLFLCLNFYDRNDAVDVSTDVMLPENSQSNFKHYI